MHLCVAAHQGGVCGKLHGQVVVQPAGEGSVAAAIAFHQHPDSLAHLLPDQIHCDLVLHLEQAGHPVGFLRARGGVGHFRCLGAGTLGVDEGEQLHIADFLHKFQRVLEILLRFPGETEEDFQDTLELVKKVGYMQLFTFIYSKRTGTKAAEMPDPTPRAEKTDRMTRLLKVQDEIAMDLVRQQVGQTVRVLVEGYGRSDGTLSGRLDNNLTVEFAADPALMGSYAQVHLTGARATVLLGELET